MTSTIKLQDCTDMQIRELGYESLYGRNMLSKANIECFTEGFKAAVSRISVNSTDEFLDRIRCDIDYILARAKESSDFYGTGLSDRKKKEMQKLNILRKTITDLLR